MELEEARLKAAGLFDAIGLPSNRRLIDVGRREGQGLGFVEQLLAMTPTGFPLPQLLHFGFTRLLDRKLMARKRNCFGGYASIIVAGRSVLNIVNLD